MNDKQRIAENLDVIMAGGMDIMAVFYETLFARHPELRPLFRRSAVAQQRMVLQAILAVVEHMDDAAWLRGTLRPLGAKHLAYGVTEPMYPMVAEALLTTLAKASGSSWDVEIEGAWTRAITAVAGEMIAGARLVELSDSGPTTQPSPDSPPPPSA